MDLGSVPGSLAYRSTEYARSALAAGYALTPLQKYAKYSVLSVFRRIRKGGLVIQLPDGEILAFGQDKETSASIIVHNDYF